MSAGAVLARNEVRAQSALWLGIVGAILAAALLPRMRDFGVLLYIFGALALGAASTGHEYRHGTLTQLLTQPIRRSTVLMAKFGVLAGLQAALAVVAAAVVFSPVRWQVPARDGLVALFVLPLLYGLLVAPWLTLVTRGTLAGTLFSGSLAGLIFVTGDRIGAARFTSFAEIEAFRLTVMWIGSSLLACAAAIALWRAFHLLEVLDGVRADIALPAKWRATRTSRSGRGHPLVLLAVKELRLQQLAFVASLLYCVLYVTLWARHGSLPFPEEAISVATGIHAMIVAALVGALSCAEERSLGTLEWQLLQPMSARAQFAVKVAVTVSLTFALALGLPALFWQVLGEPAGWAQLHSGRTALILVLLLSGSTYLSSVSSSALVAFFACAPLFMVGFWFMVNVATRIAGWVFALVHSRPVRTLERTYYVPRAEAALDVVVGAVVVAMMLHFSFENHRGSDRSLRRVAGQLLGLVIVVTAAFVVFAAAGRLL